MKPKAKLRGERADAAYRDLFGHVEPPPPPKPAATAPPRMPPCACGARWAPYRLPDREEPYCPTCWSETPYGQSCKSAYLRQINGAEERPLWADA